MFRNGRLCLIFGYVSASNVVTSDNADEDSGVGTSIIGGFAVLVPVVLVVAVVVAAAFVGLDGRGDGGD